MTTDLLHYEDFTPGQVFDCGERSLSEEQMIRFARRFDPQDFHLDREAAKASILGQLSASGWQTCSVMMRMYAEAVILRTAGMGSPGVSEVRWLRPVFAEMPLRQHCEVTSARTSGSRPEAGLVGFKLTLTGPDGDVCTQEFVVLIRRREPGPPVERPAKSAAQAPAQARPEVRPGALIGATRLEDVPLDTVFDLGEEEITAEEIVAFAREYDPQPFHLSEEAGKASVFGGLAASGWHTASMWMGRMAQARKAGQESLPEPERAAAEKMWGPSPGFEDLRWIRPVLAGDRLKFFVMPTATRALASKPGWGLMTYRNWCENQRGEVAMSFTGKVMMRLG